MKIKDLAQIVGNSCCSDCRNKEATLIALCKGDGIWEAFATNHKFKEGYWRKKKYINITPELIMMLQLNFNSTQEEIIQTDSSAIHTVRGGQVAKFLKEWEKVGSKQVNT